MQLDLSFLTFQMPCSALSAVLPCFPSSVSTTANNQQSKHRDTYMAYR